MGSGSKTNLQFVEYSSTCTKTGAVPTAIAIADMQCTFIVRTTEPQALICSACVHNTELGLNKVLLSSFN
jgi:hypothetical protein